MKALSLAVILVVVSMVGLVHAGDMEQFERVIRRHSVAEIEHELTSEMCLKLTAHGVDLLSAFWMGEAMASGPEVGQVLAEFFKEKKEALTAVSAVLVRSDREMLARCLKRSAVTGDRSCVQNFFGYRIKSTFKVLFDRWLADGGAKGVLK